MRRQDPGLEANLELLRLTVTRLSELADEFVFVGGCATGLLVTDVRPQSVRVTIDVDVVVEVTTVQGYYGIETKLEQRGFERDRSKDAPLCRWVAPGLQLDVVPAEPGVIGPSNRWYPLAVESAVSYRLSADRSIRLITAPVFIATKLEAFKDRGRGDLLASHDLEDIVTVVNGRAELLDEIAVCSESLRDYLRREVTMLLSNPDFLPALAGHLPPDAASQARLELLGHRMRSISALH